MSNQLIEKGRQEEADAIVSLFSGFLTHARSSLDFGSQQIPNGSDALIKMSH